MGSHQTPSALELGQIRGDESPGLAQFVREVADTARHLIRRHAPGWCATMSLLAPLDDREGSSEGAIGIDPASAAVRGELLRIDDHLLDCDAVRLVVRNLLRRDLEPFIEGVGEVWVAWGEPFESIVVLAGKPHRDFGKGHMSAPLV